MITGPVARVPAIALLALLGAVAASRQGDHPDPRLPDITAVGVLRKLRNARALGRPAGLCSGSMASTGYGQDSWHSTHPTTSPPRPSPNGKLWTDATSPGSPLRSGRWRRLGLAWAYLLRTPLQLAAQRTRQDRRGELDWRDSWLLGALLGAAVGLLITVTSPLLRAFDAGFGTGSSGLSRGPPCQPSTQPAIDREFGADW